MNLKIFASIGIAAVTVSGIVSYDLFIKDKALSTEVVVAKERIEKHSEFNRSNLVVERRNKDELVEGYITPEEIGSLYGLDTNVTILENQVISKEYVEFHNLSPDPSKGEAIRPIPSDWIYAMPGSIRRKDIISIYPVRIEEQQSSNNLSIQTVDDDQQVMSKEDADNSSPEEVSNRYKPILENVTVSYVKTSSNQEVMSEEKSDGERLTATGTASDIEVNITEEQLQTILHYIDQGYKLYISYR